MKIIFVNRYFYPDSSQTSRLLADLAFELAGLGSEVHVVTSRMCSDKPGTVLPATEEVLGVHIHRVWTSRFGKKWMLGRAADYLTFHLATERRLLAMVERGDRVVAKSDPPMLPVLVAGITRRRNAVQFNWLHEIFPEVAAAQGVHGLKGPVGRRLMAMRSWALNNSYVTVVPSQQMCNYLYGQGVEQHKLKLIRDWVDGHELRPMGERENPLRDEWSLRGKFIVGYVGDLGRAHEYTTILNAADRLRHEREIRFLIVGGGALVNAMRREARRRNLSNLIFQPNQEGKQLRWAMGLPDVHLVVQRSEMEGLRLPGKFYRVAAAGKPVLLIGGEESEMAEWVHMARMGTTVEVGDAAKLARRILAMRLAPDGLIKMGVNARKLYRARFAASRSLAAWVELLGVDNDDNYSGNADLAGNRDEE
jgi:glycosyltransferase involved in cell wall biosynthesis